MRTHDRYETVDSIAPVRRNPRRGVEKKRHVRTGNINKRLDSIAPLPRKSKKDASNKKYFPTDDINKRLDSMRPLRQNLQRRDEKNRYVGTSDIDETLDSIEPVGANYNKGAEQYRNVGTDETNESLDSIEPVPANTKKGNNNSNKYKMETNVQRVETHRQYSTEGKGNYLKNKRKRPSSPEDTHKNKQKLKVTDFYQNASLNPDSSDNEGIRSTKPAYQTQTSEESSNNIMQRKKPKGRLKKDE